ncbi:unnamed protein product [Ilex paraguariensis]|uniref:Uncharacterized protein n=1 Tax=Ilex paraguariensis TaxID=185542 RepID=A0ABC8QXJ6_9AQUA
MSQKRPLAVQLAEASLLYIYSFETRILVDLKLFEEDWRSLAIIIECHLSLQHLMASNFLQKNLAEDQPNRTTNFRGFCLGWKFAGVKPEKTTIRSREREK